MVVLKSKMKSKEGSLIVEHAKEFCNRTTIHGLRYLSEDGVHWFQSILWSSFVTLGAVFCCILMILIWNRFYNNPTITAVETINYPIWNVPFPAVTFCNVNKVHKPRIDNILKILMTNGISEENAMKFFSSLSNLIAMKGDTQFFMEEFKILKKSGYNTEKIMLELMQPCSEFLERCTWMGDVVNCTNIFKTIKTDEGFCCTFNYYHSNESFDNENISNITQFKEKPIHIAGAGIHTGLSIILNVDDDNYMASTRRTPAALLHVHDSLDYPEMKVLAMLLEKGELIQVPIEPSIIDTTIDVKSLHRSRRNCLFEEEETLTIGVYGYENCIIECRMNAIVDLCGCIPYYYNIKNYTYKKKLRFCEISDVICINENNRKLYTLRSSEATVLDDMDIEGLNCSCFPTCNVNWYDYNSDVGHMINDVNFYNNSDIIAIHLYFSEFTCIKYKQSNLITWDGLFASFGGIFGLCLGGSILSIVEFFYHFSIKLYITYKHRKMAKNNWRKAIFLISKKKNMKTIRTPVISLENIDKYPMKYNNILKKPKIYNDEINTINKLKRFK